MLSRVKNGQYVSVFMCVHNLAVKCILANQQGSFFMGHPVYARIMCMCIKCINSTSLSISIASGALLVASVSRKCCGKMADWIQMPYGVVSGVRLDMGVSDFGGDQQRGMGSFRSEFGVSHCNQWGLCNMLFSNYFEYLFVLQVLWS